MSSVLQKNSQRRSATPRERREALRAQIMVTTEKLLESRSVSDLTIDAVMSGTGLGRTNFYRLFEDLDGLLLELLERAQHELEALVVAWTEGTGPVEDNIRTGVRGVVTAYQRHGALFRAVAEGAGHVPRLGAAWRRFLDDFIRANRERIERDARAGYPRVSNPEATVCALVLMTEAYMRRAFEDGALDADAISATLVPIWVKALEGRG